MFRNQKLESCPALTQEGSKFTCEETGESGRDRRTRCPMKGITTPFCEIITPGNVPLDFVQKYRGIILARERAKREMGL